MPARDRSPLRGLVLDRDGAVAVEFAILAWPIILLLVAILQLGLFQYTQVQLSNALFDSAADPEASILAGDASGYRASICGRIRTMPLATCKTQMMVELARLADMPTTALAIQGKTFSAGTSRDVLLLRAGLPAPRFLPFMPTMTAKASVVFRRV